MYEIKIPGKFKKVRIGGEVFEIDMSAAAIVERGKKWKKIVRKVERLMADTATTDTEKGEALLKLYVKGINATLMGEPAERIVAMCEGNPEGLAHVMTELATMVNMR